MAEQLQFFNADTGEAVASDSTPTGRDREYSCSVHYLTWGRWPQAHPRGYIATTTNGAPADPPNAMVPLKLPVHSTTIGPLLEGRERETMLVGRKQDYERHVGNERKKLAEAARPVTPTTSPSPTGRGGKDRFHEIRKSMRRSIKKKSAGFLRSRDEYVLKTIESAREDALKKITTGLEYLKTMEYHGVAELNELTKVSEYTLPQAATDADQEDCQDLPDFERPRPFDELINGIHFMSVQDARQAFAYEGVYDFLQRTYDLRLQLRHIQQSLRKIRPIKISFDDTTTLEERLEAFTLLATGFDVIRSIYDKLLEFADTVTETIGVIREEKAAIPKELLTKWEKSDEMAMKKMVMELFDEGLTKKDERFLDRTHYTQHFVNARALINSIPGDEFCQRMEHFGRGLQEMRDAMDFDPGMRGGD
jgi:hypothetical protein